MEKQIIDLMVKHGYGVGQAMEKIEKTDPKGYAQWSEANMKNKDGWVSWAKDLSARAGEERKKRLANIDFERVVRFYQSEGLTKTQALSKAVRHFPDLHEQYLKEHQAGSAQARTPTGRQPADFETAVNDGIKIGLSRTEALSRAAAAFPELHRAYLDEHNRAYQARKARRV